MSTASLLKTARKIRHLPGPARELAGRPYFAVLGLVGIALVAVGGLVIRVGLNNAPTGFDSWWHDLLTTHRSSAIDTVALALNVVGGTLWMTLVTAAIVGALVVAGRWRQGLAIGLTVAVASGVATVLKVAVNRPRPLDSLVDVGTDSFPSGHTTTAAALTIAIAIALPRVWTWALAGVWAASMAFSRTYLLVHWASDVVAALVLGLSAALLVSAFLAMASRSRAGSFLKEPSSAEADFRGGAQSGSDTLSS